MPQCLWAGTGCRVEGEGLATPDTPTALVEANEGLARGCCKRRGREEGCCERRGPQTGCFERHRNLSFGNRCCGCGNRCCGCPPCPTRRSADSTRLHTPGPEGFVSRHRLLRRPCFWFPGERPGRRHIRGAERNECPSCATRGETRPRRKGTITSTASGTLERETARGR